MDAQLAPIKHTRFVLRQTHKTPVGETSPTGAHMDRNHDLGRLNWVPFAQGLRKKLSAPLAQSIQAGKPCKATTWVRAHALAALTAGLPAYPAAKLNSAPYWRFQDKHSFNVRDLVCNHSAGCLTPVEGMNCAA
jgi:hypothetical protein